MIMGNSQSVSTLDLEGWEYNKYFLPCPDSGLHKVVNEIENYIEQIDLSSHPFFSIASKSVQTLELWMSQELVMTNAFSQIVLAAASSVANVHLRTVLVEVASGEHGHYRNGLAKSSHPWLLHQMRESVGLPGSEVIPHAATKNLISQLESKSSESTLTALAWIGIGNERLIIPEYKAIEKCFAQVCSYANYKPFLKANVTEDILHTRLCLEAASLLIKSEEDAVCFYDEAVASINARYHYFDTLAQS